MGSKALILLPVLLGGDFNLHHIDWDAKTLNPTKQAKNFSEWVSKNTAIYELPTDTIIHSQSNAIDFVVSSLSFIKFNLKYYVKPKLDYTSNH